MAVQTRGTLQGFAALPYYWLLGDPRIALQTGPPYRLLRDDTRGSTRTIELAGAPTSVIPVRMPGGATSTFVEAIGIAAAWDGDPFFNSRLQMASVGPDRYLLVARAGGDLTLRLHRRPPLSWVVLDVLADSLDRTLVFVPHGGGGVIALVGGGLALLSAALRRHRPESQPSRPPPWPDWPLAASPSMHWPAWTRSPSPPSR